VRYRFGCVRVRACARVRVHSCVRARACECVRAHARMRMRACVCSLYADGGGGRGGWGGLSVGEGEGGERQTEGKMEREVCMCESDSRRGRGEGTLIDSMKQPRSSTENSKHHDPASCICGGTNKYLCSVRTPPSFPPLHRDEFNRLRTVHRIFIEAIFFFHHSSSSGRHAGRRKLSHFTSMASRRGKGRQTQHSRKHSS
jgi:hypothetical protein